MSTALPGFLQRLTAEPPPPAAAPPVVQAADGALEDLIAQFGAALTAHGSTWERSENPVACRLRLAGQLHDEGIRQVLSWAGDELPVPGVLDALASLDIEPLIPDLRQGQRRDQLLALESVLVGLTGADAGIASTGTLVLRSGRGRGRLVSQLPRRHIILLPASRLFATPEAWLAASPPDPTVASVTLISGPSLSADIELEPSYGVHGPRQLHVILVAGL